MEANESRITLLLLPEDPAEMQKAISGIKKSHESICFICLGDTASSALEFLRKSGADNHVFLIDTLSSHYSRKQSTSRCIYVSSPSATKEIMDAMRRLRNSCQVFVFDDISKMLNYHDEPTVLRFTSDLRAEGMGEIMYILTVGGDIVNSFIKDLEMFADSKISIHEA